MASTIDEVARIRMNLATLVRSKASTNSILPSRLHHPMSTNHAVLEEAVIPLDGFALCNMLHTATLLELVCGLCKPVDSVNTTTQAVVTHELSHLFHMMDVSIL